MQLQRYECSFKIHLQMIMLLYDFSYFLKLLSARHVYGPVYDETSFLSV